MGKLSALNTLKEKLGEDGVNALLEVIEEERGGTRDNLFHLLEERSPVGLRRRWESYALSCTSRWVS